MRCHGITSFLTPSFIHRLWLRARSSVEKGVPARPVLLSLPSSSANLSQPPAPASHVTTITRLASPIPFRIAQTKFTSTPVLGQKQSPFPLPALRSQLMCSQQVRYSGVWLGWLPTAGVQLLQAMGRSVRPLMCGFVRAITSCGFSSFSGWSHPVAVVHEL